jgi:uracil-DNA glycosylase
MVVTKQLEESIGKDWVRLLKPFIESKDWDNIWVALKAEVAKGKKIAPLSADTFKAFRLTPPDKVKAVIVGMCPYHTFEDGKPVADGLVLSCSYTVKKKGLQPSLRLFYDEISRVYDTKIEKNNADYGDMRALAQQGILCYNVALTTEEGKPMSHEHIWQKFNDYLFKVVFNDFFRGLPMLFLGQVAQKSEKLLTPMLHYPFLLSHPASAAHSGTDTWSSEGAFLQIDKILKESNKEAIWWNYLDLPF